MRRRRYGSVPLVSLLLLALATFVSAQQPQSGFTRVLGHTLSVEP